MDNPYSNEESPFLRIGTTVDILLTDPDSYDAQISYYDKDRPTPMMLKFIDALPTGLDRNSDESLYNDAYVLSKSKSSVSTIITKLWEDPRNFEYYTFRCENLGKTIVSKDEMETVLNYKSSLVSNPYVSKYFSYNINWEGFDQIPIYFEEGGQECKALLDKVIIDHTNKKIIPIDLKTSSQAYYIPVKKYEYYLQAAHYTAALKALQKGEASSPVLAQLPADYEIDNFLFIFASSKEFIPATLYVMSDEDLRKANEGGTIYDRPIKGRLERISDYKWHTERDDWQYSRDYIEKEGKVYSNIFDD